MHGRNSFHVCRIFAAAIGLLLVPQGARANLILPAASYAIQFSTFNSSHAFSAPGTYAVGNLSTTVTASPLPSLTGHGLGVDVNIFDGNGGVESQLDYYFAVNGVAPGVFVPLWAVPTITASDTHGPQHTTEGAARFVLAADGAFDLYNILAESADALAHPNFSGAVAFNQLSGNIGRVHLQIDVRAISEGEANAFATSFIYIDPDFELENPGASLVLSDGIGNALPVASASVAEPASLALFGSGLAALMIRRRRTRRLHSACGV